MESYQVGSVSLGGGTTFESVGGATLGCYIDPIDMGMCDNLSGGENDSGKKNMGFGTEKQFSGYLECHYNFSFHPSTLSSRFVSFDNANSALPPNMATLATSNDKQAICTSWFGEQQQTSFDIQASKQADNIDEVEMNYPSDV